MEPDLCYVGTSVILEGVMLKLKLLLSDEGGWRLGMKLSKLRNSVEETLKYAKSAEGHPVKKGSKICELLEAAKSAAYDADDLLDQLSLRNSNTCYTSYCTCNSWIRKFSSTFDDLLIKGKQITSIIEETEELEERDVLSRSSRIKVVHELMSLSRSENKLVFGLDCHKEAVVDRLIGTGCQDLQVSVIPIIGMAGIGKTTLARMIFEHQKVCGHFDVRAWVSVSATFASSKDDAEVLMLKIAKGIIESVSGLSCQLSDSDDEAYYVLVRDLLESKRSLIVLDDIQFQDKRFHTLEKHMLNLFFSTAAFGSKVIITTACTTDDDDDDDDDDEYYCYYCKLSPLSDEDSWSLFTTLAFDSSKIVEKENSQLYSCAKDIVAGCRGNPLALNLVGSLMRFKKNESEWLSFQTYHNQICCLSEASSHITRYVLLSFYDLPSHLKQCFAYCSVFLEGCILEKEKIIRMWIAEGLVRPTEEEENRTLEDVGNDYFQELSSRSFFKDFKYDDFGDIIECRMDRLVHRVAQVFAGIEDKTMGGLVIRQSKSIPQVSLAFDTQSSTIPKSLHFPKHLRTLFLLSGNFPRTLDNSFSRFKFLRVLDLSSSGIERLSSQIHNLKHLRYLDLSHTHIEKLPSCVTKIVYLETLKLLGCYLLQRLPEKMHNMTKLRHLDVGSCHSLSHATSTFAPKFSSIDAIVCFGQDS